MKFQYHEKILLKVCLFCILISLIKNGYNELSFANLQRSSTLAFDHELQKSINEARFASLEKIPIRELSQYDLEMIPGISTTTSLRILRYLEKNKTGKINLLKVKGLGFKKVRMLGRYFNTHCK